MRKLVFLSLLMFGFVAAVPRIQADPVCTAISKTTRAGSVNAQLCIDLVADTITLKGTITLPDGTVYKLDATGAITTTLVNGRPVSTLQADIVITDGSGNVVWERQVTLTSSSLAILVGKFASTVANLPGALSH